MKSEDKKDPFIWWKQILNLVIIFIGWGLWESGEINLTAFMVIAVTFLINMGEEIFKL